MLERKELAELNSVERAQRDAARKSLLHPPVKLSIEQTESIAAGFAESVKTSGYTIWACAIMPQHTHLVVARHRYQVEQVATILKGAATRQIMNDRRHPIANLESNVAPPTMWARGCWKVCLDSEGSIETAIRYVEDNPVLEEKPRQTWPFVSPFRGLDAGWVTYH